MIDWQNINDDKIPESNRTLVVKSPEGFVDMAQWRTSYDIFTCQGKRDSSDGWQWAYTD